MWLGVCNWPFATVNFEATQESCAQLMIQFVPGDLVGSCQSVVMARFSVYIIYMLMNDDRRW